MYLVVPLDGEAYENLGPTPHLASRHGEPSPGQLATTLENWLNDLPPHLELVTIHHNSSMVYPLAVLRSIA